MHTQTTNKCYVNSCRENVRLSWCSGDSNDNKVGLEVDGGTENGTIVLIFCRVEQNNQFVKRMIFNYEIGKCVLHEEHLLLHYNDSDK